MTPAERIRYFFLIDRELSEDKLAAMSQKDREAIEQQIKEVILQQLGLENEDGKPDDAPQPAPEGDPVPLDATPWCLVRRHLPRRSLSTAVSSTAMYPGKFANHFAPDVIVLARFNTAQMHKGWPKLQRRLVPKLWRDLSPCST
ncbi:hypothetical protein [Agrobacterium tumefaciens]|jgi:hypothetical protein|uniref:hypothetical protein n=1 Tax=Agrobacterium tumefaciens TaxID=358 RepID=UPI00046FF0A4